MAFLTLKSPLSAEERLERRRIVVSDALSLTALFAITVALALITNRFYQSYASHQIQLANRWKARGTTALRQGNPQAAITALRSALAYAPGDRSIEISLAEALAAAGHIEEADAYFNTLVESEPGNGMINLQLARLAARQNNVHQALEYYHRAIYGDWEGDGYLRRRQVRMELVNFLISQHIYDEARNELLVAAGNSPEQDLAFQFEIATAMEKAQDPAEALNVYRKILKHDPSSLQAVEGAARTAYQLDRYAEAKQFLERAVNHPAFERQPAEVSQQVRDQLPDATRLLSLYPSPNLRAAVRSARILKDRDIASARFSSCLATQGAEQTPAQTSSASPTGSSQTSGTVGLPGTLKDQLQNLTSHFQHRDAKPAGTSAQSSPDPAGVLTALAARWKQLPPEITLSQVESNPDLAQSIIQLVYDTERATAQVCGPPTGDDALLLKIAEAPDTVEME